MEQEAFSPAEAQMMKSEWLSMYCKPGRQSKSMQPGAKTELIGNGNVGQRGSKMQRMKRAWSEEAGVELH